MVGVVPGLPLSAVALLFVANPLGDATKGSPPRRTASVVRGPVFATFGSATYCFIRLFV
jgi:hypothetical protein